MKNDKNNLISKLKGKFLEAFDNGKYLQAIALAFLMGISILAVFIIIVIIVGNIISFIVENIELIFLVGGGSVVAIILIKQHYQEKREIREAQIEAKRLLQEEVDADQLERNYRILRTHIFDVVSHLSDILHLKKPIQEFELDAPIHTTRKSNFILYAYLAYPLKTDRDYCNKIKEIMQIEINKRLETKSFYGLAKDYHLHDGQFIPMLNIFEIKDNSAYITIYVALADDGDYCKFIRKATSAHLVQQAEQLRTRPQDEDF